MKYLLALIIVLTLFFSTASVHAVFAQVYKFQLANTATPAATVGNDFDVKVLINTAGKQTLGGDAIVVFDNNILSIKSAQKGTFFEVFQDHTIGGTTNKYLLSAWQTTEVNPVSTSADSLFGTVTFTAKTAGNATLSFDCTSGSTDSNIWDTTQADILKCADVKPLTFTIGGPGPTATPAATMTPAPTAIPQPTSTPAPSNTPRPTISVLPRSGTAEVTIGALGIGAFLTMGGLLIML